MTLSQAGKLLFVVMMLLICAGFDASRATASENIFIRGYVVARLFPGADQNDGKIKDVYLPRATVTLEDITTGNKIFPVVTDLSGRFTFKLASKGTYRVCAEADGFNRNCIERLARVSASEHVGTLPLTAKRDHGEASIYGDVRLLDGKRPRILQPYLDRNAFATVSILREGTPTFAATVNNFGEYVIPSVPTEKDFLLLATVENNALKQEVDHRTGLLADRAFRFNLTLETHSPKIRPIHAKDINGKVVQIVRPGDTLKLHADASDPDGDRLTYNWLVTDGNGTLSVLDAADTEWKVPAANGRYSVNLLVTDDRGGHDESQFAVSATTGGVRFSGIVKSVDGQQLARAIVEVNNRRTRTRSDGSFSLQVEPSDRYVTNIRMPGFALSSNVYARGMGALAVELVPAEIFNVDPKQTIIVSNRSRKASQCKGAPSEAINWEEGGYLAKGLLQWQDGNGRSLNIDELNRRDEKSVRGVAQLFNRKERNLADFVGRLSLKQKFEMQGFDNECGEGISVEIPADSLVDEFGNLPSGNVSVSLSTIDLQTPGQMPGDYSASDVNGKDVVMESFGAGAIEVTANNKKYNLRPGAEAKVTIPVDRSQRGNPTVLPAKMPLLYFNETTGSWKEEGELDLVNSGAGLVYETKAKHFSTLNADLLFSGQACVSVVSGVGMPASYAVEVTVPPYTAGASPNVKTLNIDNSSGNEHLIYNLPLNQNIVLVPIISGTKPDGSTGSVPAGVFVVNTGGQQTSASSLPPGPPYYTVNSSNVPLGPCMTQVVLSNLALPSAPDAPNQFLQGLGLQSANLTELTGSNPTLATEILAQAQAYLDLADPRLLRRDLLDFKTRNNFLVPPNLAQGELLTSASFANSGDLGFGRNMNCRKTLASDGQFDIACYVTNYGDHLTPDATDAEDAALQNQVNAVATVAMEYSRVENPLGVIPEFPDDTRTVKFFVYAKAAASTVHLGQGDGIVLQADLDGAGARPVPQLCMVCHGGASATQPSGTPDVEVAAFAFREDVFMNSRFLPFDLRYYTSPPVPNTLAAQEAKFRSLNLDFVKAVPASPPANDPIVTLIDEMYPLGTASAQQDPLAVVAGWDKAVPGSPDRKFYLDVFAPACRTCHLSSPFGNLNFADKGSFQGSIPNIQTRVCDQHVMPHARRTHDLFWTSLAPNMAAQLQFYGEAQGTWDTNTGAAQCGLSFTAGGNNPVSTFTSKIQPILTIRCANCHGTVSPFAGLTLSAGSAYGNLVSGGVGVASTEHPSLPRIFPGVSANSYLYRKVENTQSSLPGPFAGSGIPNGGQIMPPSGGPLTGSDQDGDGTNDREEIRRWIDVLGAPGP